MIPNDPTRNSISWRQMDRDKLAESYKRFQAQRGGQVIDPSEVRPMTDTVEIHTAAQASAASKETAAAAQASASVSDESAEVSMEVKVNIESKTVEVGKIQSGTMQLQGIGYKINDDWSLTPFISCLPADDPNSALPFFEKQLFGKNTSDPFANIMKYLTDNLPTMQGKFSLGNRTVL